ncbi:MAG: hypothetical protein KBC84_04360 [Proteobacteria bacterium]|nr:hypothetical protein [Pseudomonadota bacterium]
MNKIKTTIKNNSLLNQIGSVGLEATLTIAMISVVMIGTFMALSSEADNVFSDIAQFDNPNPQMTKVPGATRGSGGQRKGGQLR